MCWNFVKNMSKLPVPSYCYGLMRGYIVFGPTELTVALDVCSTNETEEFSRGPPTGMTGGRVPWASGMKPLLQHSTEASAAVPSPLLLVGSNPTTLLSDSSFVHRLGRAHTHRWWKACGLSRQLALSRMS